MASFDFTSFMIGLLIGAIITLLLIWWAYSARAFIFTYCASQPVPCGGGDYYNDPGDALANNNNLDAKDILFLNDNEEMFYKRVQKVNDCTPESNQTVYMKYPQYCSFSSSSGESGTWRETAFNSNIYLPDGFAGPTIITDGNCIPNEGSSVTSGIPLVEWDANPIY